MADGPDGGTVGDLSQPEPVRSPRNPRVAAASRLRRARERRLSGRSLLEGPTLLAEAVAAGIPIVEVFTLPETADEVRAIVGDVPVIPVDARALGRIADTRHPRGPVAVIEIPPFAPRPTRSSFVLWGVGDPGNVGTLIRTAAALALDVVVGPETADVWAPKVLRAAAGGHFRTRLVRLDAPYELFDPTPLHEAGLRVVATVPEGGAPPWTLGGDATAVLVGDEARGLPEAVIDRADGRVTIPMPGGTESLNAAVAGAIVGWELVRSGLRSASGGAAEVIGQHRAERDRPSERRR